jgi:hypothetical protein
MSESTDAVTISFSTLVDPVRRYVLEYVTEQEAPVTSDRLAVRVAAWRTDCVPMRSGNDSLASSRGVPGG